MSLWHCVILGYKYLYDRYDLKHDPYLLSLLSTSNTCDRIKRLVIVTAKTKSRRNAFRKSRTWLGLRTGGCKAVAACCSDHFDYACHRGSHWRDRC